MKLYKGEQIRKWDESTINSQKISSLDLMERAANTAFVKLKELGFDSHYSIFCGPGNNGGDGLALARLLWTAGINVDVYIININGKYAEDFRKNLKKLEHKITPLFLNKETHNFNLHKNSVVLDCIFGTGLSRAIEGLVETTINSLNALPNKIISIDIPSGLFADSSTYSNCIKADITLSFQVPKLSFLFPETGNNVGKLHNLDIGLENNFEQKEESSYHYTTEENILQLWRKRKKFDHKGNFGHLLLTAGSKGKMGAAQFSTLAALKTGVGLATCLSDEDQIPILQITVPEAMCIASENLTQLNSSYNAIVFGPGSGKTHDSKTLFKYLLKKYDKYPFLIDADGINLLAEHRELIHLLPEGTILTPHLKEFERLVGSSTCHEDRLKKAHDFAYKNKVHIALKGANTCIITPDGDYFFNSTGNPGMATAGSGDTLSGIIASLQAQGYSSKSACILGVYILGLAGDIAAATIGQTSLCASDIINNISNAIQSFENFV